MQYLENLDNFNNLVHIIREQKRHCDYDTVIELADLYRMMITGKDDEDIYHRFYKKFAESEDPSEVALYEQLQRITNLILKPVTNRIAQPFNKVPRSNAKTEILQYVGDTQNTKLKELQSILDKFWGVKSFDDWMNSRFLELSKIDPNSWCVIEFAGTDGSEVLQPYPFEVKSKNAIYFEFINNILQYLVVIDEEDENGVEFNAYTLYGKNSVIKLSKVNKTRIQGLREVTKNEKNVDTGKYEDVVHSFIESDEIITYRDFTDTDGNAFVMFDKDTFYMFDEFLPHNLGFVNAFRIGYLRDDYTDGRTFVNFFDCAIPYLLSTVKVTCEKDLSFALHVFGKRYEYDQPCRAEGCNGGHLAEGGECTSCHGTGSLTMSSTMEVVKIPLPRSGNGEEIWDLSKMSYTDRPSTDIIDLQLRYIDSLVESAIAVIFNSDVFVKPNIKDTATSKILDYENVYDVLYPFAVNFANQWEFGVKTIAKITDKEKDLIATLSFGKDFRFESKVELVEMYKTMKEAGMSQDILGTIESKIIQLDNFDNKDQFIKWSVKKLFDPFYGKTPEEIMLLMAGTEVPKRSKVLYANYGAIWDNLEAKQEGIYSMTKTKIKEYLALEVDEFMKLLEADKPKTNPFSVNMPTNAVKLDEEGNPIE